MRPRSLGPGDDLTIGGDVSGGGVSGGDDAIRGEMRHMRRSRDEIEEEEEEEEASRRRARRPRATRRRGSGGGVIASYIYTGERRS